MAYQDNYFSWTNIAEMGDIGSHIDFADTLFNKYQWEEATRLVLQNQLKAIHNKQDDKKLNISVIGEFSTGKSSFINALVGYELLAVNVLQGTTVAITIIEYGPRLSLTLTDFAEKSKRKFYDSIDTLRRELQFFTTDTKYAKKINYVTVTLPANILKNGYRIIDTPGTNSLELWHEDITRRAIQQISDLSIILTDATKPMPQTLTDFIDNVLADSLKEAAFVANKIDRIKPKERTGIVKFIKNKVADSFELEHITVVPFSSVALTNAFSIEKVEVDNESFRLSIDGLTLLLDHTARQRVKAQARKIISLIKNIYSNLELNIQNIAESYQKELKLLERSRQVDLLPFIEAQVVRCEKKFLSKARDYKFEVESFAETKKNETKQKVINKVEEPTSTDKLADYIKKKLADDIKDFGYQLGKDIEEKFYSLRNFYDSELKSFQKEFKKEFQKLKILSIDLPQRNTDVSLRHTSHKADIAPVVTLITSELSKENWAFGGGAAAGAIVGTAIAPGVGTLIGAAIGFFAGGGMAPDFAVVKKNTITKLEIPLSVYLRSVVDDSLANYSSYVEDVNIHLKNAITSYYSTYSTIVEKRIDQWNENYSKIKTKINNIEKEITILKNRQTSIQSIISHI